MGARGWIKGQVITEDGSVDKFELDQDLDATPSRFIQLSEDIEYFELRQVKWMINPTNGATYEMYLLEAAAAGNVANRGNVVFDSGAAQVDSQMYIDGALGGKLPMTCDLSANPGKLYYVTNWTIAPGTTPGQIKVLGKSVA